MILSLEVSASERPARHFDNQTEADVGSASVCNLSPQRLLNPSVGFLRPFASKSSILPSATKVAYEPPRCRNPALQELP